MPNFEKGASEQETGAAEVPKTAAELRMEIMELNSEKARLQEKLEEEALNQLASKEGLEALQEQLESDPLVEQAMNTDISEKERLELLEKTKIPLTKTFGLASKFRKFMLASDEMKQMSALDEKIENLAAQAKVLEEMEG